MKSTVQIIEKKLLSDHWYKLYKYTFDLTDSKGETHHQTREVFDRGNSAVILLYNRQAGTVILTRQFRLPAFVNGHPDGMMIEACAGMLDEDDPEDCIRRETEEETGYRISNVQKLFEAYMSPGGLTEMIHFFIAEYTSDQKVNEGGGLQEEQENIEVLEFAFQKAYDMIGTSEIKDAKTIMLLQYARLHIPKIGK